MKTAIGYPLAPHNFDTYPQCFFQGGPSYVRKFCDYRLLLFLGGMWCNYLKYRTIYFVNFC